MKYFDTKIRYFIIICFFLLAVTFPSYGKKSPITPVDSLRTVLISDPDNVMVLHKLGLYELNGNNDSLSTVYGNRLLRIANAKHDDEAATYGKMILGHTALMQGKKQQAYRYLYDARHLAEHRNDSLSLASIFNGMGIYAYYYSYDLANAITYYFKGMECAKAAHDDGNYYKLLNNIANAYLERNDTTGIEYARECYDHAKEVKDYRLLFSSALCLAEAYYKQHDYTRFSFSGRCRKNSP